MKYSYFFLLLTLFTIGLSVYALMQPLWSTPTPVDPGVSVDPGTLRKDVLHLVNAFAPRDAAHPENLRRCADYINKRFKESGARVSEQVFRADNKIYVNVIASFGPETGERLIVGAHYDTAGPLPGADDNTSGVVGLLTLAHWLGKAKLTYPIDLIAYTLEEPPYFRTPFMGSAQHAALLKQNNIPVKLMISLEMIAYFSDAPNSQTYPIRALSWLYPSTGNFIAVVGKIGEGAIVQKVKSGLRASTKIPVHSVNAPRFIPGIDFSDHQNYWNHGYPAIMITDTANFRNPNYHTASDTPDTLNYEKMAEVLRGVYYVITTY